MYMMYVKPFRIHLFGVRFDVWCHVTYDADKPRKFGHSNQPRTTHAGSFQIRLPVTTVSASKRQKKA